MNVWNYAEDQKSSKRPANTESILRVAGEATRFSKKKVFLIFNNPYVWLGQYSGYHGESYHEVTNLRDVIIGTWKH